MDLYKPLFKSSQVSSQISMSVILALYNAQTRYMINENIFQRYLPMFEGGGQTVSQYMVPAYYWLGWGIEGKRETYAYEYTKKLVKA